MSDGKEDVDGVIGVVPIHGRPVIYAIVPELPSEQLQSRLPHLVVVAWKYNGDANNGMPDAATNERMLHLQDVLSPLFERRDDSVHAYNRTGDNLKEFAYYVADTTRFMRRLNDALEPLPYFPIEITFVHDEDWSEFRDIASLFRTKTRARSDA